MVVDVLLALVKAVVWIGGWSQLVGVPVAWLRVRRSPAWTERPDEVRRIDLLADFIRRPTVLAILWTWFILVVVALGDFEISTVEYLALIWGPPTVFVPMTVLRLDISRFPEVVDEAQRRQGAG